MKPGNGKIGGEELELIRLIREDMNRLRGRLFQALEAMGLPEKQCDAAKGLVRHLTYDSQRDLESTIRSES